MSSQARNPALEAAAFADFDDLDAWRVYADWLQSVGDPRGEIVGLELHRHGAFLSERKALARRIAGLEAEFSARFVEQAAALGLRQTQAKFARGFLVALEGPCAELAPVLDQLFADEPVQRLIVSDCEAAPLVDLLATRPPWLAQLRYLKLGGEVGAAGCQALVANPLPSLRRLNLLGAAIDEDACAQLAKLDTQALESLTLTFNQIDDAGLERLLEAPTRSQWRALYLSSNPIEAAGIQLLATVFGLEGLERLYLKELEVGFAEFTPLLESHSLPNLRVLELGAVNWWRERALYDRFVERFGAGLQL